MTEKQVKEALDFLCQKYGMCYDYREKQNYAGYRDLRCFSYYNKDGCFTITDLTQSDDVEFVCLDDIGLLDNYILSPYSEKLKNIVRILSMSLKFGQGIRKKGF